MTLAPGSAEGAQEGRPDLLVLAWTRVDSRQREIARLFGAPAFVANVNRRFPIPVRYAIATWKTIAVLRQLKPLRVFVTAPPVPAAFVVAALARPFRYSFLLDSHPGAFGLMGDRLSGALAPLHRYAMRRAVAVAVTTDALVRRVEEEGGRGLVLHEVPSAQQAHMGGGDSARVLVPFSGTRDEPLELVRAVAERCPELQFRVTGSYEAARTQMHPANLRFLGYLSQDSYLDEFEQAGTVLVLSTEPESVMRTAYEATYLGRALVVSDTDACRRFFPHALHVRNARDEIASGLQRARFVETEVLASARDHALTLWRSQEASLRKALDLTG